MRLSQLQRLCLGALLVFAAAWFCYPNAQRQLDLSFPAFDHPQHCYGRKEQMDMLEHQLSQLNPLGIQHIIGPKGSGKTTLAQCVLMKRKHVAYIHWRYEIFKTAEDLNTQFRKMFKLDDWYSFIQRYPQMIVSQILSWLPTILTDSEARNQRSLYMTLAQIEGILKAVGQEGSKKPVIFMDEFQSLKKINDPETWNILFNWLLAISKDLKLAHVIVASSDSFLYQNKQYQKRMKNRYISFIEVYDLSNEDQKIFIDKLSKEQDPLSDQTIKEIGGHVGNLVKVIGNIHSLESSKYYYELDWNEMNEMAQKCAVAPIGEILFDDEVVPCYTKKEMEKIIRIILDKYNPHTRDFAEANIPTRAIEKLMIENFIFYYAGSRTITFVSNLQAVVWRQLIEKK